MTKRMHLSAESIQRLSSCHPDLVRVMVRAARVTNLEVVRGATDLEHSTSPTAKDLRRPSDAVTASPPDATPLREPECMYRLSTADRADIVSWVRNTARWYYLGGVVMGVAETLRDQDLIDQPVRWMGLTNGGSGLSRVERGTP